MRTNTYFLIVLWIVGYAPCISAQNKSLISCLSAPSAQVRRRAIAILGDRRQCSSAHLVQKHLEDEDEMVRATAAWALGQFADPTTIPQLIKAQNDNSWQVRCAVVAALGNFPHCHTICNALRRALSDKKLQVRYTAIRQFGKLRCKDHLPFLQQLVMNEANPLILQAVCQTLADVACISSLPALLYALSNNDSKVRRYANLALTKIAPQCESEVTEFFFDRRQPAAVRYQIGLVLGRIRAGGIVSRLVATVNNCSEPGKIRYLALLLLIDFVGTKCSDLLIAKLADPDIWVQRGAILGVGKLRIDSALPQLVHCLKSPAPDISQKALWAISQLRESLIQKFVLQTLAKQNDKKLIMAAIRLTGDLKIHQARALLMKIQYHDDWRPVVAWALQQLRR